MPSAPLLPLSRYSHPRAMDSRSITDRTGPETLLQPEKQTDPNRISLDTGYLFRAFIIETSTTSPSGQVARFSVQAVTP
jgi:hypothetical protein